MKKIAILALLLSIGVQLYAQNIGHIQYKQTLKLDFQMEMPEGIDLSGMLPENQVFYKDLFFDQDQSLYKDAKENESIDTKMENEDGSIKIMIQTDETEEILFTDLNAQKSIHQQGFMGKYFLIEETLTKSKWKLTGEKIMYLDYECHKAISTNDEGETIAWFTPSIAVQHGPNGYNQLPGMILMLSTPNQTLEIMATKVTLDEAYEEKISAPTKGEKMNKEEFEKIIVEKTKEMQDMYGGKGVIIRN